MKKLIALSVVLVLFIGQLSAQEDIMKKGNKVLNLGLGLGNTFYGSYYTSRMPGVTASFEVAILDKLIDGKGSVGVGGYLGYSSAKYADYYKTSNFIFGARGAFHYPLLAKLDTYTGLMLGYNVYSYKYYDSSTAPYSGSSSGLASSWFLGARYYFSENFAGMAELGYGVAILTVGVALKF